MSYRAWAVLWTAATITNLGVTVFCLSRRKPETGFVLVNTVLLGVIAVQAWELAGYDETITDLIARLDRVLKTFTDDEARAYNDAIDDVLASLDRAAREEEES